jgi:hypothetical protein
MSYLILQHYDDSLIYSDDLGNTIFFDTLKEAEKAAEELESTQIVNCGATNALFDIDDVILILK